MKLSLIAFGMLLIASGIGTGYIAVKLLHIYKSLVAELKYDVIQVVSLY